MAISTASKMADRLGIECGTSFSNVRERKYLKGVAHMEFHSDYEVGQRLQPKIPVTHSLFTSTCECVEAECEVLEIRSLGDRGWWIRMGYAHGEFAALEKMDGQLTVQAPVGKAAWQSDDEFLYGEDTDFSVTKHGAWVKHL